MQKVANALARLANPEEFDAFPLAEIPAVPLRRRVIPMLVNAQAFETSRAGTVSGVVESARGRMIRQGRFMQVVVGA